MTKPSLILASASSRRLALLGQLGVEPDELCPMEIDETPRRAELPRMLALRLARSKAQACQEFLREKEFRDKYLILAADTVVGVGRRILPKAQTRDEAEACLHLLSGRSHRVRTALCAMTSSGVLRQRFVETRVRFKRLSNHEMEGYLASGQWQGKAGGYAIQGLASFFVVKLVGSYTNIVGLPLYETGALLTSLGIPIIEHWINSPPMTPLI